MAVMPDWVQPQVGPCGFWRLPEEALLQVKVQGKHCTGRVFCLFFKEQVQFHSILLVPELVMDFVHQ